MENLSSSGEEPGALISTDSIEGFIVDKIKELGNDATIRITKDNVRKILLVSAIGQNYRYFGGIGYESLGKRQERIQELTKISSSIAQGIDMHKNK